MIAIAPALPLHTAGKYVAGAYIAFLAIVLIYVAIMATRLARTERELSDLAQEVERRRAADTPDTDTRDADRDREPVA
jgi:HAMP domain-containing protein